MPIVHVIKKISGLDGTEEVIFWARNDGFVEFRQTRLVHEGGHIGSYFASAYESGIFQTLEDALAEAGKVIPWFALQEDRDQPLTIDVSDERIAFRKRDGTGPGLVWLGGWRSDMNGSKAVCLNGIAGRDKFPFLRFDYSGHGLSSGHWRDGTISKWVAESLAVFRRAAPEQCILVGSSMGAWITLRLLAELQKAGEGARIKGIVLIAPAPDFSMDLIEPQLTDHERALLDGQGWFEEMSDFLPEPNRWSKAFIDDGRNNRVLTGIIDLHCPVHVLQGLKDAEVPHTHALKLVSHLPSDRVTLTLIPDGDHRLARQQDLELLERIVLSMRADAKG